MNQNNNDDRNGPPAGNWIKLHRKILVSRVFANPDLFKLWCLCLLHANYKNGWVQVDGITSPVEVRRGQFITGRLALHKAYYPRRRASNKSSSTVWRWLETLQKMGNLRIETHNKFSIVTIVNYDVYQTVDLRNEHQMNNRCTTDEQEMHTNKKDKKVKKVKKKSSCPKLRFDEQDMLLAHWMFDLIRQLQPGRKEPNFEKWANTIRTMREQDGRTDEDIRDLFGRANQDPFWQTNILSPDKLREKYDDLDLKLRRPSRGQPPGGAGATSQGGRAGCSMGTDSPARIR